MSYCFSFQSPKALPTLSSQCRRTSLCTAAKYKPFHNTKLVKKVASVSRRPQDHDQAKKSSLAIQFAALLATIEQPAFAITGVNNPEDLTWVLIQLAIVTFCYFILMPVTYHLELALEKIVQEKAFGDVFAIHVRLHFLSRDIAVGTISELQEIPSGSILAVPMVQTRRSFKNQERLS
ncbi:hypothetical protein POTOM_036003 [Populus tomentosa]|uniref:Uncharacterized protein n=1 Tax=Populus tomentosa TaxID=118781 RepID=A0A8X7Z1E5_POPTO|nr:hypothetical protein POTOM_036003 [Populus tomentosa]